MKKYKKENEVILGCLVWEKRKREWKKMIVMKMNVIDNYHFISHYYRLLYFMISTLNLKLNNITIVFLKYL